VPPETARTKHVLELPVRNGNGSGRKPLPVVAEPAQRLPGLYSE